jgi:hypothetical protein
VYIDFIALWNNCEGSLPNDDNKMCAMLQRNPRTWRKAKDGLVAKGKIWVNGNDYWTGKRLDFEHEKVGQLPNSNRIRTEFEANKSKNREKSMAVVTQLQLQSNIPTGRKVRAEPEFPPKQKTWEDKPFPPDPRNQDAIVVSDELVSLVKRQR